MKLFKKFASFVLAFAMVMAIAMPSVVKAEGNGSITITDAKAGHTFEAYQIFAGDVSGKTLSNLKWGSGVTKAGQTALGNAKDKVSNLKNDKDAETFAYEVSQYLATAAKETNVYNDGDYVINGLAPGYYLVKDKDGTVPQGQAYTKFILMVVGSATAKVKSDVPTSEKKVKDTNDTTGETTNWQDSADYDIGDTVPFQLTGTVADDYYVYKGAYQLVFHDTLSKGLTLDKDSFKVYKNDENGVLDQNQYKVSITDDQHFTVTIKNVKDLGGDVEKVRVEYTAKLNDKAAIGSKGNPNTMFMEFSNNPNSTQGEDKGQTPEDTVIVFTYKTIVNKVKSDGKPLQGAEFTLYKNINGNYEKITKVLGTENDGTTFTFTGLDDGEYKLEETVTPEGYNTMDPMKFSITASHETEAAEPKLTGLNGKIANGEIEFTANKDKGTLTANVVNYKGSELPSTGGMGTTVLYAAGVILILAAGAFLVMQKKAENK